VHHDGSFIDGINDVWIALQMQSMCSCMKQMSPDDSFIDGIRDVWIALQMQSMCSCRKQVSHDDSFIAGISDVWIALKPMMQFPVSEVNLRCVKTESYCDALLSMHFLHRQATDEENMGQIHVMQGSPIQEIFYPGIFPAKPISDDLRVEKATGSNLICDRQALFHLDDAEINAEMNVHRIVNEEPKPKLLEEPGDQLGLGVYGRPIAHGHSSRKTQ
jgi:hypothetical protein